MTRTMDPRLVVRWVAPFVLGSGALMSAVWHNFTRVAVKIYEGRKDKSHRRLANGLEPIRRLQLVSMRHLHGSFLAQSFCSGRHWRGGLIGTELPMRVWSGVGLHFLIAMLCARCCAKSGSGCVTQACWLAASAWMCSGEDKLCIQTIYTIHANVDTSLCTLSAKSDPSNTLRRSFTACA